MPEQSLLSFAFTDAIKNISSVDDYLLNGFNRSVANSINSWLLEHPWFYWLVHHPWISTISFLILVIFTIKLLGTIYRAIANAIDRLWLAILRFPLWLFKLLFGWSRKADKIAIAKHSSIVSEGFDNPEQLQDIVRRLDLIQQQQAQILLEMAKLKQES